MPKLDRGGKLAPYTTTLLPNLNPVCHSGGFTVARVRRTRNRLGTSYVYSSSSRLGRRARTGLRNVETG